MNPNALTRRDALQRVAVSTAAIGLGARLADADVPRATPQGSLPDDPRLGPLKDLNGYFPFSPSSSPAEWAKRKEYVKRQLLVACGLWPMPPQPPVQATVHGRVERDTHTVDRVYFESSPGLYVTGSLYRPQGCKADQKHPVILCPHGHWSQGRFHDWGETKVKQEITAGAEKFEAGGRHPLQARCVQLARMGCIVFLYDMQGYADGGSLSYQLIHRFAKQRPDLSTPERWGMFSAQSELRLINALGIQTWNSIRALDWLTSLPDVDADRIGITGASGGGTQTFMLAALDERVTAAFPAVMVSTAMQGGCTCENATYLRVNTGNIEIAALTAPRPIAMSGANDWTVEIETKGLPELKLHFDMLGVPENVEAKHFDFPHNYTFQSRTMMYDFFNRHLKLEYEKITESDFKPLSKEEATVFNDDHPAPVLDDDHEVDALRALDELSQQPIAALIPTDEKSRSKFRRVVGGAFEVMIGRGLPDADEIEYKRLSETERDGFFEYTAFLNLKKHGEQLPTAFLYPKDWNKEVVIWLSGQGKSALFNADGSLTTPIAMLVRKGYAVASIDPLYTGEFLKDGKPLTQSRKVPNPREFAGYTLGYNHPLFSQRVHDILTVMSFVKNHESEPQRSHLVGLDTTGVQAAAACAVAPGVVDTLHVSTGGFRFGSITDIRDVNLLPGAVKYGDVPAILALCAPTPLHLLNDGPQTPKLVRSAYGFGKGLGKLSHSRGPTDQEPDIAARFIIDQS